MKKLITIATLVAAFGVRAFAADDFYGHPTADATLAAAVTAEITAAVLVETTYAKPQVDTNATTTATLKTPRYIGDMLIGSAGSGTGAVWVATSVSTNGWLAIKP